jgi:hypothetical protein
VSTDDTSPATAGPVVQRGVRPCAWWRESIYAECWPCVTVDEKEAEFWRSEGLTVVELGDVAAERAESARLRHLLNLARDDYNTAAQRLQDIGDYAHDHSTGPAVPDALWEVCSMAYGSGA